MHRIEIRIPQKLFGVAVWTVLFLTALPVSHALAQKGKPKPPLPPPSPPIVTTQEIVYSTYNSQGIQSLVVADRDGTNRVVIDMGKWYHVPSWHPDGDEIIFSSAIPEPGIWSIRLNRGSPAGVSAATRLVPTIMTDGLTTPVWSPLPIDFQDGSNPRHVIAYADRPVGKTTNDIFIWDPETSSHNLTNDDSHWESYPTWSPDGSQLVIVHTSATGDYPYDMKLLTLGFGAVFCAGGQNVCEIAPQESLVRRLEPDPGASTLDCYVPADGDQPSPLCGPTIDILRPKFGNTGHEIALSSSGIWVVPLDAPEDAHNLIANIVNFPSGTAPSWSPDDRQIVYWGSISSKRTVCGRKNWNGLVKINSDGSPFSNGCYVEFIIDGPGRDPSWWRGTVQP